MSDSATCDVCGAEGRRRRGTLAPEGWFYGEHIFEGCELVTWACSEACREAFWKLGPGKLDLSIDPGPDEMETLRTRVEELEKAGRCLAEHTLSLTNGLYGDDIGGDIYSHLGDARNDADTCAEKMLTLLKPCEACEPSESGSE